MGMLPRGSSKKYYLGSCFFVGSRKIDGSFVRITSFYSYLVG